MYSATWRPLFLLIADIVYHKLFDANPCGQVCRSGRYFQQQFASRVRGNVALRFVVVIVVFFKKIDISDEHPHPCG
jgi:hypothetical protein